MSREVILNQYAGKFPSLQKQEKPLKTFGSKLAGELALYLMKTINIYSGGSLKHQIGEDIQDYAQAWASILLDYRPDYIIETLIRCLDGKSLVSSRHECPMPRSAAEFVSELRNTQHNTNAYQDTKNVTLGESLRLAWDNSQEDAHRRAVAKASFMIMGREPNVPDNIKRVCFDKLGVKSEDEIDAIQLTDYEQEIFEKQVFMHEEGKRKIRERYP